LDGFNDELDQGFDKIAAGQNIMIRGWWEPVIQLTFPRSFLPGELSTGWLFALILNQGQVAISGFGCIRMEAGSTTKKITKR